MGGVGALWRGVVRYGAIWRVACALYKVHGLAVGWRSLGVVRGVSVRCMRFGWPLVGFALPYPSKGGGQYLPWRLVPYIKDAQLMKKKLAKFAIHELVYGCG